MTETETNGVPQDNSDAPSPPTRKTFRKIKVLTSQDGQWYYIAQSKNGEPIYTSETFTRRAGAIKAARREHEGRSERFDYILEYETAAGHLVKETL